MQNKILIAGVGVVVVLGIAAFFLMGGSNTISKLGNASVRELLASGQPQKCTYVNNDNGNQTSGTIYVAGGKMRGDFNSQVGATQSVSHMVISNDISYVWIEGNTQGWRMAFNDMAGKSTGTGQGIDADSKVGASCEAWQAQESTFALPTDVTFMDVNALVPPTSAGANTQGNANTSTGAGAAASGSASTQSYAEQQCAACNMITDANAKAQCKASFDCR